MPRVRLTISKEAQNSLVELQRKMKKPPSDVINELLIGQYKSLQDDELCKKDYFPSCIIYTLQMPFAFPFECECFNLNIESRSIKLYLERVPKRYVIHRLPFNTEATIIIELDVLKDFPDGTDHSQIHNTIIKNTTDLAFSLIRNTIIYYRRITKNYYNIGVIKPPMYLEEFTRNIYLIIMHNNEYFSTSRRMPVKETSEIIVKHKLDDKIRNQITDAIITKKDDFLYSTSYDLFDQSKISYYDEEWNVCLIQGVIAMESALSHLVQKSKLNTLFSKKEGSKEALHKNYKNTRGLPKKICRFLFPILQLKNLEISESELRKLMPLISNKKTEQGIYDLRNKIVHEGESVSEKKAKEIIEVIPQFFKIINSTLE